MTDTLFDIPEEWWVRKRCRVCGCALFSQGMTHTYIVQRQWWVKIGGTNNPRRRMNELSRPAWAQYILYPAGMDWDEPLLRLGVIEGWVEHESHVRFRKQHVIGEWFLPDDEMRQWIEEVTQ